MCGKFLYCSDFYSTTLSLLMTVAFISSIFYCILGLRIFWILHFIAIFPKLQKVRVFTIMSKCPFSEEEMSIRYRWIRTKNCNDQLDMNKCSFYLKNLGMAYRWSKACLDVILLLVKWLFPLSWKLAFQSPLVGLVMPLPSEDFSQKGFIFTRYSMSLPTQMIQPVLI